jgi:predicted neutral ceramidase superfamily lipid hydrolase
MDKTFYIGLSVGILAGLWTFGSLMLGLVTFAGFLAWASYYAAGGGLNGFKLSLFSNISGVIWAALMVLGGGYLATGLPETLAFSLCVTLLAAVMVWQSYWPPLSFIPGAFIGCSAYFATGNLLLESIGGLILGAVFGLLSQKLGEQAQSLFSAPDKGTSL